jgi:hypothetical protein
MQRRFLRRALTLAVCVVAAISVSPAGTQAQDVQDMHVSRQKPMESHDYGAIPVNNAEAASGLGTQVLLHRPAECRTAAYCDVIDVNVDASSFTDRDAYELRVEVTWTNPDVNDIDLFIYDQEMGRRVTASATDADPEMASVDRPPTGKIFAVINNFSGPNLGYHVDVDLHYVGKLKEIPKFERDTSGAPHFTPLPELTAPPTIKRPEQKLTPGATLAPVLTPGPDGLPTSLSLESIKTGAKKSSGGTSMWVILVTALVGLGVLGGTGVFLLRRVRRA